MAGGTVAELNVAINATDNASGVISGVAAQLGGLSGAAASATVQTGNVNSALNDTARAGRTANAAYAAAALGGTALNNSTVTAASGVAVLEQRLQTQKNTTMQYAREVRNAKNDLQAKQAVLESTAKTYKATTTPIKENISSLKTQQSSLADTIKSKEAERDALQDTNKTLKRSSQAYKDNQSVINKTCAEIKEAKKSYKEVSNEISTQEAILKGETATYKTAQANVKAAAQSHEELRAKMKESSAAEKEITAAIEKGAAAQSASAVKTALTAEEYQKSGRIIKEYGEGVDTLTKPLQVAAVAAIGLGAASTVMAVKFEDNFANVKKTVEGTPEQLEAVRKGIIDMTTVGINGHGAIPQTTAELTELAAAGGQLGIQTENILDFTETMAMLGSATNLQGEAGAQTLARFMNVANVSQKDIGNLGSAIVDLGNNFATTEAEIANMAMDMGATGATVGMSAQDILGYATALSSMGIEAAAGGSALQRIWMEMQNSVSNGGDTLAAFAKVSGKSSKEFQKQWKEDATGAFNDFLQGLNKSEDQVGLLTALGFNNVRDQRALLALAGEKGFDILTEAIKRSNKAWEENTALQKEFENKQQTTASQIKIAKNNVIEAGRAFGETLLPDVVATTGGIAKFAQGLANLDDSGKKAIITGAKGVVIAGALSKGSVGVIKGIGNTADALGKIKKASEAGGIIANIATVLPTVASVVGPVALGIAGIATAAVAGKKAYDNWYNSKYHFSSGLKKDAENLKTYNERWQELNNLQWEYNDLSGKLSRNEIPEGDVEAVKARIDEIKQTLSTKFKIDVDSSDLDAAVEKAKELEGAGVYSAKRQLRTELNNLKNPYDEAVADLPNVQAQYAEASKKVEQYDKALYNLANSEDKYTSGTIDAAQYTDDFIKIMNEAGKAAGKGENWGEKLLKDLKSFGYDGETLTGKLFGWAENRINAEKDGLDIDGLQEKIEAYKQSIAEYKEACEEMANIDLSQMRDAVENGEDITQYTNDIAKMAKDGLIDGSEYAKKVSNIVTGVDSMSDACSKGGKVLNDYIANYIDYAKQFGASTEQAVQGAALIKEGFKSVSDVGNNADNIQAVVKSLQELGNQQGLDMSASKLTEMAQSMNLIPESKHIEISAEGNISVIDDMKNAVDELNSTGAVNLSVSANGDISVLDTANTKLKELVENGEVTVEFNPKIKQFDITDLDGNVIGTMEIDGTVHWKSGEVEKPEVEEDGTINYKSEVEEPNEGELHKEGTITWSADKTPTFDDFLPKDKSVTVSADTSAAQGSISALASTPVQVGVSADTSAAQASIAALSTTVEITLHYSKTGDVPKSNAQGTRYFGGGLAMVNDEVGRADKRELVVDRGRAFIPQGENVVLPLSKGAKVYTTTQTQRILKSLGIAQYAGGKDNDDIFGTLQSLGLSGIKVQKSMPDTWHTMQENLYEWKNGGSMAGAPNSKDFELEKEKFDHEKKTRAMSTTEELQKWIEFSKQFNETEKDIAVIEEQIFSLTSKISDELNKQSAAWIDDRVALNDWQGYGDSAIAAFDRVKERNYKDFQDGLITWQEYTDTISDLGSDMYSGRIKHSKAWLEHEENYNGMSTDDYLAGIDRMRTYTEEYYAKGMINHREYVEGKIELDEMYADKQREKFTEWEHDADAWENMRNTYGDWDLYGDSEEDFYKRKIQRAQEFYKDGTIDFKEYVDKTNEYSMDLYKAQEGMYDDMLSARKDYISDLKDEFAAAEKELQDSWTIEDRKADMSEVSEQLDIYSGAVTDRGQQKYKELQEQMKQLQRDEELYQLQVANNATIEALEDEYKQLEADKSVFLRGIKDNFDIDVSSLLSGFKESNNTLNRTLEDVITAINNIKMEQTVYTDSRKIQNNISHITGEQFNEIVDAASGR